MYRKKYLIGIYAPVEEGETLLALCSSIKEFAELMEIRYDNAVMILHLLFTKKTTCIRFCRRLCSVVFIPDEDKTEEEVIYNTCEESKK